MTNKLRGSMVAVVTPMTAGSIDYTALEALYEIHAAAGTDGVVICGTTGESATMTHQEHRELIQHAANYFKNQLGTRAPLLVAGTGSNSTQEAVELSSFAAEQKVDALLVITPYYNKPTPQGQIIHFTKVAEAAGDVPIILYNVPGRTGLKMQTATVVELSKVPNITALKEASGDLGFASEVVRQTDDDFVVLSGEDNLTLPLLSVGASGVISVTANIAPEMVRDMVHHFLAGRSNEALAVHQKLFCLTEAMFCETNPIPVKTALNLMAGQTAPGGLTWPSVGELRLPMCPLCDASLPVIQKAMKDVGLLN